LIRDLFLCWIELYEDSGRKLESLYPESRCDRGQQRSLDKETCLDLTQTNHGSGVVVVQSLSDFEAESDERAFMRGVLKGMVDLEEGRELNLEDVKKYPIANFSALGRESLP